MKAQRFYTALMILLGIALAMVLRASTSTLDYNVMNSGNPPTSEEAMMLPEFNFEDEPYINDIPFDTECISRNCLYWKAVAVDYEFDEETYIDDIPFNTEEVSAESSFEQAMNEEFELEDEAYVDDIPFDTYSIANESVQSHYAFVK